jgi:adenosylcobinamide-GDP ribazoletransferase
MQPHCFAMSLRSMSSEYPVRTDCPAWAPPLLAVQFLTRIPVPGVASLPREAALEGLSRAVIWFPLVGALVGAVTAATIVLAEQLWPRIVAVLVALAVEARLTGAFHEDAVADFCDGAGGGKNPEHVREIMKDSRIGTFGAFALLLSLALRVALTMTLPDALLIAAVVGAATFGRLVAVMVMTAVSPMSGSNTLAKDVGGRTPVRFALLAFVLAIPGLLPLAWSAPLPLAAALVAASIFVFWFRRLLLMRVGGSTGDCLGFAAYIGQLLLLLAASAA